MLEKFSLKLLILITGLIGFAGQIILLRELLIIFSGNEFTIGIIIANWLILEAVGSYFLGKTADNQRKVQVFILFTLIFCLYFPLSVYLTRILKPLLGISIGESLGLQYVILSSFLILLPLSITHGAMFTYSCKIYSSINKEEVSSISQVYIFETIGTLFGSFIVSYLLIIYLNTFKIVFLLNIINILFCIFYLFVKKENKILITCSIFLTVFLISFLIFSDILHWISVKKLWGKQKVVEYQNSKYNNICVTQYENQYTFFINGRPSIITPIPNINFVEEYVNIPLLLHKNPQKILVISGGVGGILNEILKHPTVKTIDYVELDPFLMKLIERFSTDLTQNELNNNRVFIYHIDGKYYLKQIEKKYDIAFIGLSDPQDLQTNRFFTKEFFKLLKTKLNFDSILVLTLTGSLTYLSKELIALNNCIYNTLLKVFNYVYVLPGDGKNIYIVSDNKENVVVSKQKLIKQILSRKIKTRILFPRHIEYKLNPRWQQWFFSYISKTEKEINSDLKPTAVFYSLAYWNSIFSPFVNKFIYIFKTIKIKDIIFFMIVLWLGIFFFIGKNLKNFISSICIFTTGFAGMIFDLIIITSFQSTYGYIFHWLGFITGFFMVGTTLGNLISNWFIKKFKLDRNLFTITEFLIFILSIFIAIILLFLKLYFEQPIIYENLKYIFLILSLISGIVVGFEFPIANSLQIKITGSVSKTAGLIYSCDLLGGWFAGIISSIIFLPIFGVFETCFIVATVKFASFTLLLSTKF